MEKTFSKIAITFNKDLQIGQKLSFDFGVGEVNEVWTEVRYRENQVSFGPPTEVEGERTAINFLEAISLDYKGLFKLTQNGNQAVIEGYYEEIQFSSIEPEIIGVFDSIENFDPEIALSIDNISFLESDSDPCGKIKVSVTTNMLATKITQPVVINDNTENPFTFEVPRGWGGILFCEAANGQTAFESFFVPGILSASNISYRAQSRPSGTNLTVFVQTFGGLELEYSLDNTNWQTSNMFPNLPGGTYMVYVRDQFGCKISKGVNLDAFGIETPYFYLSKSNSIQYKRKVDWGVCSDYKNDENTLGNELNVPLAYTEIQQFQTCDTDIPTQFRSNYANISAKVTSCDGKELFETVHPIKKTNNMSLQDRRDALAYSIDGGDKTGVWFTQGNIYDYTLGTVTGNYTLNGLLPEWGVIGNYVKIEGVWGKIENIIFNEDFNAEVLVIDRQYMQNIIQVSSYFDQEKYEVYEFSLDMSNYENKKIKVEITNQQLGFETVVMESEIIDVRERQKNTVEIKYFNKVNTDIFYATGIVNKLRLPIERIDAKLSDETETYKTDTTTQLLSTELHEGNVFELQPVTKQMMWKITQALSHSNVEIDGVAYVKESVDVEGALEDTNLYTVKATMTKAKGTFETNGPELDFSGSNIEIPGLVSSGDGFVEY